LNYLHAQLQGGSQCAILGLPLTNSSYSDSVALLQDKYDQPHRIITAHIMALIDMSGPTNSHDLLQHFMMPLKQILYPFSHYLANLLVGMEQCWLQV